jgi:UDP-N-acetylmuramoylalanine-D-glutamate ligase
VGGPFTENLLDDIGLVAISPGLSPLEPNTRALLEAAQARGIPVWGEIELFAQALATWRPRRATPRACWPSPAPTARPRPPR